MNLFLSFDPDQLAHIKLLKKDEIYILFQDDLKLVIQVKELEKEKMPYVEDQPKVQVIEVAIGREYHRFGGNEHAYIRTHIQMNDLENSAINIPIKTEIQRVQEGRI